MKKLEDVIDAWDSGKILDEHRIGDLATAIRSYIHEIVGEEKKLTDKDKDFEGYLNLCGERKNGYNQCRSEILRRVGE